MASDDEVTALEAILRAAQDQPGGVEALGMLASLRQRLFGGPGDDPLTVGPFRILRKLGIGGMGVVYDAYDPRLQRHVALKVMRRAAMPLISSSILMREARAIAQLSHPNVIAVHEVGESGGETYIAMELVDGSDLGQWQQVRRSRREILDAYRQAAEGISAAHRCGIVHGDFKPQNVLRDKTGRVRVVDFGLARAVLAASDGDQLTASNTALAVADGSQVSLQNRDETQVGQPLGTHSTVGGTPAYMAPEQLVGGRATPASDQYSFCVALHDALLGFRPVAAPQSLAPPTGLAGGSNGLPKALRRALARGLAADPAQRWPSMAELSKQLVIDPSRRRRQLLALGVALAFVFTAIAFVRREHAQRVEACLHLEQALDTTWSDERRAQLREHIVGTDVSGSATIWSQSERRIDAYVGTWKQARSEACVMEFADSDNPSAGVPEVACLGRRRQELASFLETLSSVGAHGLLHVVESLDLLPSPTLCIRATSSDTHRSAAPQATALGVAAVKATVLRGREMLRLARFRNARRYAEDAITRVDELGATPLRTEVWQFSDNVVRAVQAAGDGSLPGVKKDALEALTVRRGQIVAGTASLTLLELTEFGREAESQAWRSIAQRHVSQVGRVAAKEAFLNSDVGVLLEIPADYEAALTVPMEAEGVNVRFVAEEGLEVAKSMNNLAVQCQTTGHFDEAALLLVRARELLGRHLGQLHPYMGVVVGNLGILAALQRREEAAGLLTRSLLVLEESLGPEHIWIGPVLSGLCRDAVYAEPASVAEAICMRALRFCEAQLGAQSPRIPELLGLLARVRLHQDHYEAAQEAVTRGLLLFDQLDAPSAHAGATRFIAAQIRYALPEARKPAIELARAAYEVVAASGPGWADDADEIATWLADRTKNTVAKQ